MDYYNNPNYSSTDKPYKPKLICYNCRKVFKRKLAVDIDIKGMEDSAEMICPNCGNKADYIGPKFRAPKSDNIKAWTSIETLSKIGVLHFFGWANSNPEIPESTKGLKVLLLDIKTKNECSIRKSLSTGNKESKESIKFLSAEIEKINVYLKKQ